MADEAKHEDKKEEAPAGPRMVMGMPLPQFAFAAVNVLVMLGGTGYIAYASLLYKKPPITETQARTEISKKEEKKQVQAGEDYLPTNYPEMTITLRGAQGGKPHYATVEATLICGTEACSQQVKENKAKVEDVIQTVVSSRTYTELGSLETKFRIKHEILSHVNSQLKDTAALDVLFTNFVVQ